MANKQDGTNALFTYPEQDEGMVINKPTFAQRAVATAALATNLTLPVAALVTAGCAGGGSSTTTPPVTTPPPVTPPPVTPPVTTPYTACVGIGKTGIVQFQGDFTLPSNKTLLAQFAEAQVNPGYPGSLSNGLTTHTFSSLSDADQNSSYPALATLYHEISTNPNGFLKDPSGNRVRAGVLTPTGYQPTSPERYLINLFDQQAYNSVVTFTTNSISGAGKGGYFIGADELTGLEYAAHINSGALDTTPRPYGVSGYDGLTEKWGKLLSDTKAALAAAGVSGHKLVIVGGLQDHWNPSAVDPATYLGKSADEVVISGLNDAIVNSHPYMNRRLQTVANAAKAAGKSDVTLIGFESGSDVNAVYNAIKTNYEQFAADFYATTGVKLHFATEITAVPGNFSDIGDAGRNLGETSDCTVSPLSETTSTPQSKLFLIPFPEHLGKRSDAQRADIAVAENTLKNFTTPYAAIVDPKHSGKIAEEMRAAQRN